MRFLLIISSIYFILFTHAQTLLAQGEPCFASASFSSIKTDIKPGECPPFVDYAGTRYTTVLIGRQCWLKENLNVGKMISSGVDQANNSVIEKYCYKNDESRCGKYGAYYQWDEAMQYSQCIPDSASENKGHVQGICPDGWHIPTVNEFNELSVAAGRDAEKLRVLMRDIIKVNEENLSGFNALLAGYRDVEGGFWSWGSRTLFWSSSEYSASKARNLYLQSRENSIQIFVNRKNYGFHIRCLKD